jgi:hypothetical protein
LLSALALAACGGTGIASISLTNDESALASDLGGVTAVNIAVKDIEVHVADGAADGGGEDPAIDTDNRWFALGVARSIDLKALESVEDVFGDTAVPVGKITQIRLLIDTAGTNNVMKGETVCTLDTTAVSQTGVKITHPFKAIPVENGKTTEVLVNFVAVQSVMKESDCAYRLQPVITVKAAKVGGVEVPVAPGT